MPQQASEGDTFRSPEFEGVRFLFQRLIDCRKSLSELAAFDLALNSRMAFSHARFVAKAQGIRHRAVCCVEFGDRRAEKDALESERSSIRFFGLPP